MEYRNGKVILQLEDAVTVSKEGSVWDTLALGGVCSLGVSRATPHENSALSVSLSHNLNSPFWAGATGSLSGSKSTHSLGRRRTRAPPALYPAGPCNTTMRMRPGGS